MADYERLDYGSPDGCLIGDSSAKIGFFGATPKAKATLAQQTTKTTTRLRAEISALQDELVLLGLIAVS